MGTVSSPQGPNEGPDYLLLIGATNHKERIHKTTNQRQCLRYMPCITS